MWGMTPRIWLEPNTTKLLTGETVSLPAGAPHTSLSLTLMKAGSMFAEKLEFKLSTKLQTKSKVALRLVLRTVAGQFFPDVKVLFLKFGGPDRDEGKGRV